MVGVRMEIDERFSWTLLRRMDSEFGIWLTDLNRATECQAKLAVARNVMEECFEPIVDRHTGINVIENVMYNRESSYPRVNFRGFYSAILEKDDEIISVASVRIHGTKLAEMPLIATRERFRNQGMCRRLMVAIEDALCDLKVENLVIPSIEDRKETWKKGYGFQPITPSLCKELTQRNTLTFHDSLRLQKTLSSPATVIGHQIQAPLDLNSEPPEE
jgi:N-acetylglutamate synthase-like GNAT family acetyltransferase